jgi:hypothetical protein
MPCYLGVASLDGNSWLLCIMPCYLSVAALSGNSWLLCSMPCYLGVGALGGHSDMLCSSAFSSKVVFCSGECLVALQSIEYDRANSNRAIEGRKQSGNRVVGPIELQDKRPIGSVLEYLPQYILGYLSESIL